MIPILLAHGALGPFDELLFIVVVLIFGALMAFAWVRSRNTPADIEDIPPAETDASASDALPASGSRSDHFPLT